MTQPPSQHWRRHLCLAAVLPCLFLSLSGCLGEASAIEEPDVEAFCKTQRHQFHEGLWAPLFVHNCQGCHNTSGLAPLDAKSRFVLLPETYPNAAQANLDAIASLAREKVKGTSYVLAKVSNEIPHGGGRIFEKGSKEYVQLQNFIAGLENKDAKAPSCENIPARMDTRLSAMRRMESRAAFRKAAINIAGRLPTAEEDARLGQSPEQLNALLDALLEEEAFYERLKEIFNDMFVFSVRGQSGFSYNYFKSKDPGRSDPYPSDYYEDYPELANKLNTPEGIGTHMHASLWEEPLALIAYVARNNRPFTEILTANYAIVNDYTAFAYNVGAQPSPNAPVNAWRPATLWQRHNSPEQTLVPSAGVLSSAAFLAKFPTNAINISRGRAEFLSKNFLATSILTFAQRPVNSTQLDSTDNPTINNAACSVCHHYMDGLAGTFRGFTFWPAASYQPHLNVWNDQKYLPSFQGENFPQRASSNLKPMPWMAQRIAADARFPYAMVLRVFEGVTGRKPLEYPRNTAHPQYAEHLSAWESQNAFLHETAERMAQQGMNIKVAFREILLSPYFQAAQDANLPAALAIGLGEGRLLTPEMLARKIRVTLGAHWGGFSNALPSDALTSTYNILYGGIHPTSSAVRLTQINTLMAAVASAMAREMGCRIPAWEFSKPLDERLVLTKAKAETIPLDTYSDGLKPNPLGENAIRENLAYLHQQLLGEFVSPHSPEVNISYELFVEAWKERASGNTALGTSKRINFWNCEGRWNLNKANSDNSRVELTEGRVTEDLNSTIYAWQAVLTYLLMDFRFIHE